MKPLHHVLLIFDRGAIMATTAPNIHKHLSADALFALLRNAFSTLSDHRSGTPDIALSDALMSAFAMFSLKSPSLLAFDKERTERTRVRRNGAQEKNKKSDA